MLKTVFEEFIQNLEKCNSIFLILQQYFILKVTHEVSNNYISY